MQLQLRAIWRVSSEIISSNKSGIQALNFPYVTARRLFSRELRLSLPYRSSYVSPKIVSTLGRKRRGGEGGINRFYPETGQAAPTS